MKKLLILLTLFFTAALAFAQKAGNSFSFSTKDLNGNEVTSEIFSKNKITMVNIWGTFCPPCIREMPGLAKLNEKNKDRGVEVVGLVIDLIDPYGRILLQQKRDADIIIEATGANYTHILPDRDMLIGLLRNVQAVPATFFVDKNGKIIGQIYLGARSQRDWQKIIDKLLAKESGV